MADPWVCSRPEKVNRCPWTMIHGGRLLSQTLHAGEARCDAVVEGIGRSRRRRLVMLAAERARDPKIIEKLAADGTDFNLCGDEGYSPLDFAAVHNPNPEVVRAIMKAALGPDPQDDDIEVYVLMAAGSNPSPKVLAVLLESGFDPDHGRWTIDDLLRAAAVENTNPEVVKTLLARGAEIDSRDENGMTPLMKAAMRNRNPEVIMTLLRAGADPSLRSYDDMTAFDYMELFNGNMERWDNRVWQIVKEACSQPGD